MNRLRASAWPAVYVLLTAGVTGAWWTQAGYVWLLDSVWGPHQAINWAHPSSDLGWQIIIVGLGHLLTPPIAEKLMLSGVLLAAGLGAYLLGRRLLPMLWAGVCGLLYMLNPFVYERLLAGQWMVLAGYALLPVAVALTCDVIESHGRRHPWRLAVVVAVYPLVSPHFAYITAWLLAALLLAYVAINRPPRAHLTALLKPVATALMAMLAANAFWLLRPGAGNPWPGFTELDLANFRTAADPQFGVWGNIFGLYGFWRGASFFEPKDLVSWWWLVALIMLALAALGVVRLIRTRPYLGVALVTSAAVSAFLAAGYSSSLSRPVVAVLIDVLPGFSGLRDTGKLIGVLALAIAVFAAVGAHRLAGWLHDRWAQGALAAAIAILAAVSVTGLWGGYNHQVTVADYPAGWYQAKAKLPPTASAVVLPWHGYLRLDFVHTYAAQPAPVFFTNTLLVSNGLDNALYDRAPKPLDRLMLGLTSGATTPAGWATELKKNYHVTHVILLKTDDWQPYATQLATGGLSVEFDDPSITLYSLKP